MPSRIRSPQKWVTSADAARLAGVSRQRIQQLVEAGGLRSQPFGLRGMLVYLPSLAERYELKPMTARACAICNMPMQRAGSTGVHRACERAQRKEGR